MALVSPRRRVLRLFAGALAAAALPCAHAQQASEAAVKAALLFRFTSYVEWPEKAFLSPEAPIVIGVLGDNDVAAELEAAARGRAVGARAVVVRRLKEGEGPAGLHMLFVGRRESGRIGALAAAARPLSALVISDSERGLEAGSVINFVAVEDRIGFEVSVDAAERSALKISSRMLGVARRVLAKSS